ncbi:hypothetical protein [Alkalicoccus luteus]|uniref:Uncharacterized protein n=1 Tax=Alkalicoccus luteus TaxID=1237094 RepID=A0A969PTR5_9BACI|nr:hypothetical protein [Alkalicoccus luteus]NJP38969.1 hypothetical protein [Alkalicoccus luteus]
MSNEEKTARPTKEQKYKSARIYPDDAKLLRRMAARHDTTVVQLIEEACYDLRKKYEGKYGTNYDD